MLDSQQMPSSSESPSTPEPAATPLAPLILLFDGTCGLCDSAVSFILKHDAKKRFRFAPQQSPVARDLMARHGIDADTLDSMVLIEGDRAYIKSSAVLRIATELPEPWALGAMLVYVPSAWRDAAYDYIARHRKQWFKPRDACRTPTAEERERFLA